MDAARLQSKLYSGYGKAAKRIGFLFTIYRPYTTGPALNADNIILSPIHAAFTVGGSGFNFEKSGDHQTVVWNGLFDGTTTQPGDYLSDPVHGTYFIADQQDQLPISCIKCSHTLSVQRPNGATALGLNPYSSVLPTNETVLLTSWPGSLIYDARGRRELVGLPMDNQVPFFLVRLPFFAGIDIRPSDIITDDNDPSRKYVVTVSELTSLGWYIGAQQALA